MDAPAERVTEATIRFLKTFAVFTVEDDDGIRFSTNGKVVAHWGEHTAEGAALLRFDADARALEAALAHAGEVEGLAPIFRRALGKEGE